MPIFQLRELHIFPDPELAEDDGLIAIGGDLNPQRIHQAYKQGIFPWFNEDSEILWWSPDPRFILKVDEVKIQKSMRPLLNNSEYELRINFDFESILLGCKNSKRQGQGGTWITDQLAESVLQLHKQNIAISYETYFKNKLVGGLYGMKMDRYFAGESMFSLKSNASKYALIKACEHLASQNIPFIDCQIYSQHLERLGAKNISRKEFLQLI